MTITPDPAEISPPRDPALYARRRSGLGVWLMAGLCIVSIGAGIAIATWGHDWWPIRTDGAPSLLPAAPRTAAEPAAQPSLAPSAPLSGGPAGPDISALEGRVQALETAQARTMDAAAAALASALLAEAAESSRPFDAELAALERVLPMSPDALALRDLAKSGAPTRAALAADFDDAAAKAAVAGRDPGEGAGFFAQLAHALSAIVTVRRVGSTVGGSVDAILARAERQVSDGDIDGALRTLDDLPKGPQEAMNRWRAAAERRAMIDRRVAQIRATALADLAQAAGPAMIRTAIVLVFVAAVAVAVLALTGDAGRATLVWLGWRVDMTAASAALLVLFAALGATIFWRLLIWVLEAPARAAAARAASRRKQGGEALARGFLAAAAGDGSEARRLAQKAAELAEDAPALVRVLAAQAAEAAGDLAAAKAAYTAMLGFPEMRLAGQKGLMQIALAEGDKPTALRHAQNAYDLAKTARWAWRALLEWRLENGQWREAVELVEHALQRKIVSPIVAERTRAALLAASAADLESSPDVRQRDQALDYAVQSSRLQPGFAPGVVMAARLLSAAGKVGRASSLIENAWKDAPHPALWLAYRDLRTAETPRERAARLAGLAALKPDARESRILTVEQALIAGDLSLAREASRPLVGDEPLTQRTAGLMARIAFAAGSADEARAWIARAAAAPQEPDWSDLDPEGRAFNYTREDWARLVSTYGESGELIHPRLERRERSLSELPELPVSYVESTPFLSAAETGAPILPIPDDPGVGDLLQPVVGEPPAPRRRRRLASAPRASK